MNPKIVRQIKYIQELELNFEQIVLNKKCPSIRKFPLGFSMQHINQFYSKPYKSSKGLGGLQNDHHLA